MRYTLIVGFIGVFYLYLDGITRCIEIYIPKIISEIWHWPLSDFDALTIKKRLTFVEKNTFNCIKSFYWDNFWAQLYAQWVWMSVPQCKKFVCTDHYLLPPLQKNHAGVHVHHDAGGRTLGGKRSRRGKNITNIIDLQVWAEFACPWCQQPTAGEHPEAAVRQVTKSSLLYNIKVLYSSWLESERVEEELSESRSVSRDFSCSESCSLVGMEFFFGRPFGLVGDSSPPPCKTCAYNCQQTVDYICKVKRMQFAYTEVKAIC